MDFHQDHYKSDEALGLLAKYELGTHGMVIANGAGDKLWGEPGHEQKQEIVKAEIEKALL